MAPRSRASLLEIPETELLCHIEKEDYSHNYKKFQDRCNRCWKKALEKEVQADE